MRNDEKLESLTQSVCNKMELVRLKKGYTQRELSDRMGKYPSQIHVMLSGNYCPTVRTLHEFAEATNHDLEINFVDRSNNRRTRI